MNKDRQFIEIENLNGEKEQVEIISTIKSKRDNKTYVILTTDKEIGEDVSVNIGYLYLEDNKLNLELVKEIEEINYVNSLIEEIVREA